MFVIPYLTKEKNPNAGSSKYIINLPTEITVETKERLPELPGFYLVSHQSKTCNDVTHEECRYVVGQEEDLGALRDLGIKDVFILITHPHQTMYSISPRPAYSYVYDETYELQCRECGECSPWGDLRNNDDCIYGNDYDPAWNDEICPECGEYSCCDFSFQK